MDNRNAGAGDNDNASDEDNRVIWEIRDAQIERRAESGNADYSFGVKRRRTHERMDSNVIDLDGDENAIGIDEEALARVEEDILIGHDEFVADLQNVDEDLVGIGEEALAALEEDILNADNESNVIEVSNEDAAVELDAEDELVGTIDEAIYAFEKRILNVYNKIVEDLRNVNDDSVGGAQTLAALEQQILNGDDESDEGAAVELDAEDELARVVKEIHASLRELVVNVYNGIVADLRNIDENLVVVGQEALAQLEQHILNAYDKMVTNVLNVDEDSVEIGGQALDVVEEEEPINDTNDESEQKDSSNRLEFEAAEKESVTEEENSSSREAGVDLDQLTQQALLDSILASGNQQAASNANLEEANFERGGEQFLPDDEGWAGVDLDQHINALFDRHIEDNRAFASLDADMEYEYLADFELNGEQFPNGHEFAEEIAADLEDEPYPDEIRCGEYDGIEEIDIELYAQAAVLQDITTESEYDVYKIDIDDTFVAQRVDVGPDFDFDHQVGAAMSVESLLPPAVVVDSEDEEDEFQPQCFSWCCMCYLNPCNIM